MADTNFELTRSAEALAKFIDADKIKDLPDSKDPMLALMQADVRSGAKVADAIISVVDKVSSTSQIILGLLDFPPNAKMSYTLTQELAEQGIDADSNLCRAAISFLGSHKQIDQINNWWFRLREPLRFSQDDVDWLRGEGNYAQ